MLKNKECIQTQIKQKQNKKDETLHLKIHNIKK